MPHVNTPAETDILRFAISLLTARDDEPLVKQVIDDKVAETPGYLHAALLKVTLRVVVAQFYGPLAARLDRETYPGFTDTGLHAQAAANEGIDLPILAGGHDTMTEQPKPDDTDPVIWDDHTREWTGDFATGYRDALGWLKTGPLKAEPREILRIYKIRQQDDDAKEGTWFLDADKIPTFVSYCGEYVNVLDGPAYQAEMVEKWGDSFNAMNAPDRIVAWPGAHPWFEGFELAVAHVLDE